MPIFLLYLLITVVIFFTQLSGVNTFFTSGDAATQSYAWFAKIERALLNFDFPLWDFATDSGTTFIGELQTGAFYPPTWLFSYLPPYGSSGKFELFIALHFTWGAFGAYKLFREFGLSKISAFFGGLLFAFVGPAAARATGQPNLHAGVVQIPWMIYFAFRGSKDVPVAETLKNYACCAGMGALAILAGHMHGFIHGLLASALVIPFVNKSSWKKLIYFIPVFPFSLGLVAVQFLPTYEYFKLAYKWYGSGFTKYPHIVPFEEFGRYSLKSACSFWPGNPNCQAPEGANLFFTFSGYGLALLGLVYIFRNRKNLTIYYPLALLVVGLTLATAGNNFLGQIVYNIPILNIVRIPSRAMHLYSLAVSGLVALGFQILITNYSSNKIKLVLRFSSILLALSLNYEIIKYTQRMFGRTASDPTAGPEYYKLNPIKQFLIDQNIADQGLYRFANLPNAIISANIGNVYSVNNITAHKSSKYGAYYDYLSRDWNYLSTRFDQLGLKYIVTDREMPELSQVLAYKNIKIYQKPNPLTIFYYLKNKTFRPIPQKSKISWHENSVTIKFPENFKSPEGGKFIFAQANYPGWQVIVDQKPREILSKPALMTIKNSTQIHEITFRYQPKSVFIGLTISLLCITILIFLLFFYKSKKLSLVMKKINLNNILHLRLRPKYLDLFLILIVISVSCFLFRGSQNQGLSFDEVYRRNNLIPFFNAQAEPYNQSIYNFPRTSIPLIYKNYISSLHLIPDLFWVGFDDYLFGLRLSYLVYFILGALALYAGLRTINQNLAFWTTLLVITNPMFFPECRYGFASPIHFLFIGLLLFLINKYLKSNHRPSYLLFLISFFLFLLPNFIFYSWWIVIASIITATIIYPKKFFRIISRPLNLVVITSGFIFGHLNFILYNRSQNYPSIRPLLNFIFNRKQYNQKPIDFSESAGFLADISNKLRMFSAQYEIPSKLFLIILGLICLSYLVYSYQYKIRELALKKWIWFPPMVLALTFIFILLSPNAHRSGHFVFLSPTWEITVALILLNLSKIWNRFKLVPVLCLNLIIIINFYGANAAVNRANIILGEKHFSPAFFQLNDYINDHQIKNKLIYLHWGFYSQLYFLNRGEIKSKNLIFELINNPTYDETKIIFDTFFNDPNTQALTDPIYFPLFTDWHQFTVEKFKRYVSERGWTLSVEREFFETNKRPVFNLYRLIRSS